MQPADIDATLAERGTRYGEFTDHAKITQAIKRAMMLGRNWDSLADDMKESLGMLAHKMGRILNGDPNYHDSWHDIVGYTKLVADRILKDQEHESQSLPGLPTGGLPSTGATILTDPELLEELQQSAKELIEGQRVVWRGAKLK